MTLAVIIYVISPFTEVHSCSVSGCRGVCVVCVCVCKVKGVPDFSKEELCPGSLLKEGHVSANSCGFQPEEGMDRKLK